MRKVNPKSFMVPKGGHKMVFKYDACNRIVSFFVPTLSSIIDTPKHYRFANNNYCIRKTDQVYFIPDHEEKLLGTIVAFNGESLLYAVLDKHHLKHDAYVVPLIKKR